MSYVPSLKKIYTEQVVPELVKTRGYKNKHQVPKIVKINLNTGIDAEADKNQIADIARDIGNIAGQKPVLTKSRKAIASFKLREGQVVGCTVTLRGNTMWEFLIVCSPSPSRPFAISAACRPSSMARETTISASPTSPFSPRSRWKT
jgi:ribosomal protein L5